MRGYAQSSETDKTFDVFSVCQGHAPIENSRNKGILKIFEKV